MKFTLSIFLISTLFVLGGVAPAQVQDSNESEKILPLFSTRKTVEVILGQPIKKGCVICKYETSDFEFLVRYATGVCKGDLPGWKVRADTVLYFSVKPVKSQRLETLKSTLTDTIKFSSHDRKRYYIEERKGLKYVFDSFGNLERIDHMPLTSESYLRCSSYMPYNLIGISHMPIESFTNNGYEEFEARIQNSFLSVNSFDNESKLFVMAYSGTKVTKTQIKHYLKRLKKSMAKRFPDSQERLVFEYGGRLDTANVDLFLVPKDYSPPTSSLEARR